MKYYLYREVSSNAESHSYVSVNNFGLFENLNYEVGVSRPTGRVDYQIIIIMDGSGVFKVDSNHILLKKNHGILYKPYEPQIYNIPCGNSYLWIHFSGTEIEPLLKRINFPGKFFCIDDTSHVKNIVMKMLKYSTYNDENISNEMLNSQLIMLLTNLCMKVSTHDPVISELIYEMQLENFKGRSIEEYAKIAGISKNHLIKKFRKYTKMTPHQFKANIIIEKAHELLSDYSLNISQISNILGFDDSLYFSRFFKKNTGISPSEFRKKYLTKKHI